MLRTGNGGLAPAHALGHATYERHRSEHTLLYQLLIEKHYPTLVEQLDAQGRSLPTHAHQEFEAYLKCGRLKHGFLRLRCATCRLERLVAMSWTQRLKRVQYRYRGLRSLQRIGNGFSAGTLLKNAWQGRLHAIVQKWTDMHCAITSANNFSG